MKPLHFLLLNFFLLSCTKDQIEKQQKVVNKFYDLAYEYRDNNKVDSAFLYFLKAKDLATLQKDSLTAGNSLLNLAIISADQRDDLTSQEFALAALAYFDERNPKHHLYLSSNYNCLGKASQNLRDYTSAINFFDLAIKFSKDDSNGINLYLNNKAYLYQETKQFQKALAIYSKLEKATFNNKLGYAMALSNTAYTKWMLNPNHNVLPQLLKAKDIRENEKDLWGQNSSYSYLSDYYTKSNLDSARWYAHKMYTTARELGSSDDQLYAYQKLIKLSPAHLKNDYFERYLKLDDSAQMVRIADKNQFALIRYGVEESKADNLRLQRDNTYKKYQIVIVSAISLLTFITGFFWYRKRQQHLKLTAEKTIKENQLKTSKKVHDVVANGLYRVMTEIENEKNLDKERILDKIEDMYEKSRDISYDHSGVITIEFQDTLHNLLSSFNSPSVEIEIKGNTKELWQKVSAEVQYEIEHVLQELMVNMDKHSGANNVTISFKQNKQVITIHYQDNGTGITESTQFKNGLTNTGNRINNISGTITFDTQNEKGLEVYISFPIS